MRKHNTMGTVVTGAAITMAVGTAAYMLTNSRNGKSQRKRLKKNAGKAMQVVGDFVDNVSYMMR